jgi:hypothetical protein
MELFDDLAPDFDAKKRDERYWRKIDELSTKRSYSRADLLRNFPAYVMRRDIPRFLSHYELFKMIVDLPGCIIDLGIYRGSSFFTFAKLMETFCASDRSRYVFGFDHFRGLERFSDQDGSLDDSVQKHEGGYRATREEIESLVDIHNSDNLTPGTRRCVLVNGDITETIPRFLEEYPGLKVALLHFDMDLYTPTKLALEHLYPLVLKGGVVCFDEYGLVPWQGETRAVDEYFAALGEAPLIRKHPFAHTPHGYIVK